MKCNKCGTPIIPGESVCRICGNKTDFSKREKPTEVIDFPDEEVEKTVENIVVENNEKPENPIEEQQEQIEEVSVDLMEGIELPDLDNIVNPDDNAVTSSVEPTSEIKEEIILEEKTVEPIEPEVTENSDTVEEIGKPIENVIVENNEKREKHKKEKIGKKPSFSFGIFFLIIILFVSLAGNVYLFIMNSNTMAKDDDNLPVEIVTYSKIIYNNYKLTVPSTWISEEKDKGLFIYNDNQDWGANIQTIGNASYDVFIENKDKLVESLENLKYQFTSNYAKTVNDKNYYLFKGKYYSYSVYVIVTKIDNKNLLMADLKFKGEVDDVLLNSILTAMGTIKTNDVSDLLKDNFEFNNISNNISSISINK